MLSQQNNCKWLLIPKLSIPIISGKRYFLPRPSKKQLSWTEELKMNLNNSCLFILADVTLQLDSSFSSKTKQTPTINMGKYSVSKEEIKQLQIEAKSVLTDKLMKKVLETESVSILFSLHVFMRFGLPSSLIYDFFLSQGYRVIQ